MENKSDQKPIIIFNSATERFLGSSGIKAAREMFLRRAKIIDQEVVDSFKPTTEDPQNSKDNSPSLSSST